MVVVVVVIVVVVCHNMIREFQISRNSTIPNDTANTARTATTVITTQNKTINININEKM